MFEQINGETITLILAILGSISGGGIAKYLHTAKQFMHNARVLVDDVDDAWQDDNVTDQEFEKILGDFRLFVKTGDMSLIKKTHT